MWVELQSTQLLLPPQSISRCGSTSCRGSVAPVALSRSPLRGSIEHTTNNTQVQRLYIIGRAVERGSCCLQPLD